MNDIQFNLDNDLVFFDLETTGTNVLKDRILQIALIKYPKNNAQPEELMMFINPGIPISEESIAIHGISEEKVRDMPGFATVAKGIFDFIGNSDLSGYNSDRFDIPMLMEEFHRVGIEFEINNRRLIDIQKIFYKMEPRTLKAAYKLYCEKHLDDAHDALADVRATVSVFKGQLNRYKDTDYMDGDGYITPKPIKNDMEAIASFIKDNSLLDITQRLKYDSNGKVVFNFGKYIGHSVAETFRKEPNYYHWIIEKDFSAQVKMIVTKIYNEIKK
jgi:DNA polymerase III subunit epsilon